ncbi:hypothetical protein EYF80_008952 [Liparis tanakae]|uniref:Uncharacterized protein n=1 Tax=Liparis tanakae TaxID=230148 RepID=A0A4Z2IT56_9TELE|nr:hypothetical protein EYF80_008952 [Liparis tanakae]
MSVELELKPLILSPRGLCPLPSGPDPQQDHSDKQPPNLKPAVVLELDPGSNANSGGRQAAECRHGTSRIRVFDKLRRVLCTSSAIVIIVCRAVDDHCFTNGVVWTQHLHITGRCTDTLPGTITKTQCEFGI